MQMKNITFLLFVNMATLLCSNQPKNASIAEDQDIFLNESRKALLQQAFNSVKPQEKPCAHASYAAFNDIIKKKDTDKIFKTLRGLYSDDESFFKALAEKAHTEGFHGLAALTYQKSFVDHSTKKFFNLPESLTLMAFGAVIGIFVSWVHVNFKRQ